MLLYSQQQLLMLQVQQRMEVGMLEMGPGRRYAVQQPGLAAEPVGHWLVVGLQLETEIQVQVKLKQKN